MPLIISSFHFQTISTHAETSYPNECCGLLLGKQNQQTKTVIEVWPAENSWQTEVDEYWPEQKDFTEERRYAIPPELMLKAMKYGRERHLFIIGIYHSHPDHPAIPSEFDRTYAWPEYSYIILSVQKGKTIDFLCWSLDHNHKFQSEEIIKR
ncbi:MAG: M67 family metallopeptidase [Okeania sp. SIO2C9]|uniref:M67 family metallopeptidase n=1 Tax=Okeania sp. SIO2C9 TaxID=2607791 RepID=UPI0013BF5526|nr:M67 family metallopeptidase [Okeania sp. SIO2C9]NEQ78029.1 M67 family metallopeptidase [Okeania sp. SIO2C9]